MAAFYVLPAEDLVFGGEYGPQPPHVLDKALTYAASSAYRSTLALWEVGHWASEDEREAHDSAYGAELERLGRELKREHSVRALWRDDSLRRAIASELLESTIGVSGDRIITGLAVYDALTQIERWAEQRRVRGEHP